MSHEKEVSTEVFDCLLMFLIGVIDISCTGMVDSERNVGLCVLCKKIEFSNHGTIIPWHRKWSCIRIWMQNGIGRGELPFWR